MVLIDNVSIDILQGISISDHNIGRANSICHSSSCISPHPQQTAAAAQGWDGSYLHVTVRRVTKFYATNV